MLQLKAHMIDPYCNLLLLWYWSRDNTDLSLEGFDFDGFLTTLTLSYVGGSPVIAQPNLWTPDPKNPGKTENIYKFMCTQVLLSSVSMRCF
jgi:hypothetical protein